MKRKLNQAIIDYLKQQLNFVTSEEMALALGVSKITISRRIKEINATSEKPIILSERGRGYQLHPQFYLQPSVYVEDTASEERCNEIIKELLFAAPRRLRTFDVYEKFFVSESVVAKDKPIIAKKLKKWNLSFIRSSRHLAVVGDEKSIRVALMDIILNLHQMTDIHMLEEYCKEVDNNNDFLFAMRQVEYASTVLGKPILYPYNVSFFAHIYVLLERIRTYRSLSSQEQLPNVLDDKEKLLPEIYSVCKQIIKNIGQYVGIPPDDSEVMYLFEYLSTARIHQKIEDGLEVPMIGQIASTYIYMVSKTLQKTFTDGLQTELEKHIYYMVQRLFNRIYLPNALLKDIQLEYFPIYEAVRMASNTIAEKFLLPEISDDEVGFICLYFAKYTELERRQLNVYIVCTTGIGTSELIAVKVRQSFPMIHIMGITSNTAIAKIVERMDSKVDFLITTIPIEQNLSLPTVLISPILTNRDMESINRIVEEIGHGT